MTNLNNIKHPRICISCAYNSGRLATIRMSLAEPWKIHISIESDPGRPYQLTKDGYLHINSESIKTEDEKKAIDLINKHFFAGSLVVFSDDKAIADLFIDYDRPISQWLTDIYDAITDRKQAYFRKMLGENKLSIADCLINSFHAARKQKKRIEALAPLKEAHLGGSWQHYSEHGWIKEAEKMSKSKIYLK
jgi:hypothetical protein